MGLVVALGFSFAPALASKVRRVNLEQMTERADKIFAGRCVGTTVTLDPELGREVTIVTFRVTRAVKGDVGETVTVRMLGRQDAAATRGEAVAGHSRFEAGEEVVLFLYGDSSLGLTSPVGLGQGKFTVVEDKQGRKIAFNSTGNKTLFGGLTSRASERLGAAVEQWKRKQGVEPEALLDMAATLAP